MKSFAVIAVLLCLAAAVRSADIKVGSSYGGGAAAQAAGGYGGSSGGYGGSASIPAPPCPKNYLFSCQPSLQPAPCAPAAGGYGGASSGGYGSAGAYSANYPIYSFQAPQYVNGQQTY